MSLTTGASCTAIESAAADIIIANDLENAVLYRYEVGGENDAPANDGFNADYQLEEASSRPIKIAIARGSTTNGSEYIGTTPSIDVQSNDVVELVNERGVRRRYIVTGFEPVRDHTYLELDEVRNNGA